MLNSPASFSNTGTGQPFHNAAAILQRPALMLALYAMAKKGDSTVALAEAVTEDSGVGDAHSVDHGYASSGHAFDGGAS